MPSEADLLHKQMGRAAEHIWAEIVEGEWVGNRRYADWKGKAPPVDVIQAERIGYQVKTITNPRHEVHFGGRARLVQGGDFVQYGNAEDKLNTIRKWTNDHHLIGWLIVFLLDEETGRATVYSRRCVCNSRVSQMEPIGTWDNNTGVFLAFEEVDSEHMPPIPMLSTGIDARFPHIPTQYRGRMGRELAFTPLPQQYVNVRRHARRKR